MALDPSIILAAGKATGGIDPTQFLQAANQIKLGQLATIRGQQTQDALDRVRADPTDMKALGDLAALDPTAAKGYAEVQDMARQGKLRSARATYARTLPGGSLAPDATPLNAVAPQPAPALPAAPVAQPGSGPLTLPGTGATINIPADPSAPPAQPATTPDAGDHPLVAKSIASTTPTAQMVGSQIANGKLTPQEAAAQLLEVGDPKDIAETTAAIKGLNDDELADYNQKNKAMADAVSSVKGIPDDDTHSARMAALMAKAPQLAQIGITPQMLVHADLSDRGINGTIGQAAGYQGMFDNELKLREAAQKDATIAETKRHDIAGEEADKTHIVNGGVLVNDEGKVLYDGTGNQGGDTFSRMIGAESGGRQTGANGAPLTSPKGAVGIAQLLPSTARDAAKMAGVPFDAQKFATDPSYNANLGRAYFEALKTKYNGDETRAIAAYNAGPGAVDKALAGGGNWVARLPAETQQYLEKVQSAPMAGGLSQATIALQAKLGIDKYGGQVPPGYARNKQAMAAIANEISRQNAGGDPMALIRGAQTVASEGNAFKTFNSNKPGTGGAQVRVFNVANTHLDQLAQTAQALGSGNVPLFNRLSQSYATQTGQTAPTNFSTIKQYVSVEVLKAIEGGVGGVGDREKAEGILSAAQSPAQLAGAVKQIQGLMVGQLNGIKQSYETATGRNDFARYLSPRSAAMLAAHNGTSAPPAPAVAYLRANPNMRAAFDAKYGAGAAAGILGR